MSREQLADGERDDDELDDDELDDDEGEHEDGGSQQVLAAHPPLGLTTSALGFVVALPLLGGGGLGAALALGWVRIPTAAAPPEWLLLASLPCALAGLLMTVSVVGGLLRGALRARAVAAAPEEPWLGDHPWGAHRGRDRLAFRPMNLIGALLYALFLAPYHLLAWRAGDGEGLCVAAAILGVFDLIGVIVLVYSVYSLLRRLKYRGAELTWAGVPFQVGRPVQLGLRLPEALRALREPPQVVATLRCLRERWQTTRGHGGKGNSSQQVAVVLHAQEQRIGADRADDEGKLRLVFEVPPGVPSTDLLASQPVFWELEVHAETPGIDYRGLFLVPVY